MWRAIFYRGISAILFRAESGGDRGWLSVERGMSVVGMIDNAGGRRKYLERLIAQAKASEPRKAGLVNIKAMGIS